MSPEQARGKRLDHRTDLYSLGVMLYECATGSAAVPGPVDGGDRQHVNGDARRRPGSKNPEVSPALEALILSLLAKNPEARPGLGRRGRRGAPRARPSRSGSAGPTPAPPGARGRRRPIEAGRRRRTSGAWSTRRRRGSVSGSAHDRDPAVDAGPAPAPAPVPGRRRRRRPRGSASPLAREMLDDVLAEPMILSADERYLCGHYLAYLLGGSRRRGFLRRRPLDPRNADRARLLLAMTWLMHVGARRRRPTSPGPPSCSSRGPTSARRSARSS